jgi:predicted Zn-dependent peptidase
MTKAKQMIRGRMLIGLEESNTLAGYAGTQELLEKKIETPDDVLSHIDAVTADEVQKIAQELFKDKLRAVALLGPQKSTRAFTKVLGI